MKRSSACSQHQISKVHIADGFYDDCDELINKCSQYSTLDYQTFCNIWKEMNLGYLYQGRTSGPEIAELSEEVILIAKHYMVKDTSNFEESVAGLFLVYGLLTLQPYVGFAWLRIIPEDVLALRRIEVVARRERRFDVLYILGDVLIKRTQYQAAVRERGMEKSYRKYLEGYTTVDKLGVRPRGVFYRQNEELDIMRELGALTRQYVRAKDNIIGNVSDTSLNYIDKNLTDEMSASLKNIISGLTECPAENDEDDDESDTEHYESVQAIKRKAMVNTVDPMKHLTTVEDRKIESVKTHKSDLKAATGKVKCGSPTKPIPGSAKQKKLKKPFPKNIDKVRLKFSGSIIDEPETIVPDVNRGENDVELNLEEFDKEKTLPEENSEVKETTIDENTEVVIAESVDENLDIEIDSLPVIIRTGSQGQSLEIEIFDEYKGDEHTDNSTPEIETKPSTSNESDKKPIAKKRIIRKKAALSDILKKPELRDLKRNKLRSKFRKMGMLPAANFTEEN